MIVFLEASQQSLIAEFSSFDYFRGRSTLQFSPQ